MDTNKQVDICNKTNKAKVRERETRTNASNKAATKNRPKQTANTKTKTEAQTTRQKTNNGNTKNHLKAEGYIEGIVKYYVSNCKKH